MEGLLLLDEFTRAGVGEAEPGSSASASVASHSLSPGEPKKDEEEDVLLDG